jgi:hypothetical protein
VLGVDEKPVVAGMSELLGDGGAVRVEKEAEFRMAIAELLFEIGARSGGFGHGSLLKKVKVISGLSVLEVEPNRLFTESRKGSIRLGNVGMFTRLIHCAY